MVLLPQQFSIALVASKVANTKKQEVYSIADHDRWEKVADQSSIIVSALDTKAVEYFIICIYLLFFIGLSLLTIDD